MLDHISYSQVRMWMTCPRQWYYRYVMDLKLPPSGALIQGGSYHEALSVNFRQKKKTLKDPPVDEWLDAYSTAWDTRIKDEGEVDWEGENPGKLKDEGVHLVRAYATRLAPEIQPFQVEKPYVRRLAGIPNVGVVDLEDVNLVVIEHKTSSRSYNQEQVDRDPQMSNYGFLRGEPLEGEYHVAIKPTVTIGARVQVLRVARSLKDIQWWTMGLEQIITLMKTGVACPRPYDWHCSERFCGFWRFCKVELSKRIL